MIKPASAESANTEISVCSTFELNGLNREYDIAVCQGLSRLQDKNPKRAVELFESALSIRLFEVPNFELLPRLAIALHRSGQSGLARRTLRKAELALEVDLGISECVETDVGFDLVTNNPQAFDPILRDEVSRIMCGAMYQPFYGLTDIRKLREHQSILQFFFAAQDEIQQSEK